MWPSVLTAAATAAAPAVAVLPLARAQVAAVGPAHPSVAAALATITDIYRELGITLDTCAASGFWARDEDVLQCTACRCALRARAGVRGCERGHGTG